MITKTIDPTKPIVLGGPQTAAGKEISSRNSIQHGCCATEALILPTENIEDFQALETAWFSAYGVDRTSLEHAAEVKLIEKIITADWLVQRATRQYIQVEAKILAAHPDPLEWTEEHHKTLARFQRYRTTHNNLFDKSRKAVEDFRKNRTQDVVRVQILRLNHERVQIAQERLKTPQKKNKPEPTFEETIDLMRKKAVALGYAVPDPPTK